MTNETIWYEIYPPLNRITPVTVEKVTDSFVVINGKRCARATDHQYYEPTLESAKAKLIDHHELLVGKAASMLAVREMDLKRARNPQVKEMSSHTNEEMKLDAAEIAAFYGTSNTEAGLTTAETEAETEAWAASPNTDFTGHKCTECGFDNRFHAWDCFYLSPSLRISPEAFDAVFNEKESLRKQLDAAALTARGAGDGWDEAIKIVRSFNRVDGIIAALESARNDAGRHTAPPIPWTEKAIAVIGAVMAEEKHVMSGVELIAFERQRQISSEGWTPAHDDEHNACEMAQAAACYAWPPPRPIEVKRAWPWDCEWWKPTIPVNGVESSKQEWNDARIRDLTKAGALIAAEIDRLQRIEAMHPCAQVEK